MSQFTIEEVLGTEEFTTANGSFIAYNVRFSGEQGSGEAQHNRKAASPPPQPGEVIDAEIIHKGDRVNLKRIWKPDAAPKVSPSYQPKSGGEFRTPEQIMRGYAHNNALLYWERRQVDAAAGNSPAWAKSPSWEDYIKIVDAMYEDVMGAQKP